MFFGGLRLPKNTTILLFEKLLLQDVEDLIVHLLPLIKALIAGLFVGAHEAAQAKRGKIEDAQQTDGVLERGASVVEFDDTADENAQHLDLLFKTGEVSGFHFAAFVRW
jgi:hypothetical protein